MLQDLNLDKHVKNITEKKFTEVVVDAYVKDIITNIFSNIDNLFLGEKKLIKQHLIEYNLAGKKWKANKSIDQYPDFTIYELLHLQKDSSIIQQFGVKNLCTYEMLYSMPVIDVTSAVKDLYNEYNNIVYDVLTKLLNKFSIKDPIKHAFYPVKYYPWPYHWAATTWAASTTDPSPINRMGIHSDKSLLSSVISSAPGLILNSDNSYSTYIDKATQDYILVWTGEDLPGNLPCLHNVDFLKDVQYRYSLVNFLQYD